MTNGSRPTETLAARTSHALSVLSVFVVGIVLSAWLARWLDEASLLYLFLIPAYVAVVLTHELGHAIAGLASDFRVAFLYMGPLRVEWPRGRPVRLELNHRLSLWGGAVVVLPRSYPSGDNLGPFRMRMLAMFAAGPGASIVVGLLALGVSLATQTFPRESFGSGLSWLQLLALMSLFVGIGQVIPLKIGDQRSDGLRVLRLLRGRTGTNNALLDAMVVANADGVRPRIGPFRLPTSWMRSGTCPPWCSPTMRYSIAVSRTRLGGCSTFPAPTGRGEAKGRGESCVTSSAPICAPCT